MKNKLLNTIKEVEPCKLEYQKPANTIQGIISDIHSALATSSIETELNNQEPHLMYSDRRLYKTRFNNRGFGKLNSRSNKRCNVYLKFGFWSTNLPQKDRDKAFQRNKQVKRFITEIDECEIAEDDSDNLNNVLEEFLTQLKIDNENNTDEKQQDGTSSSLQSINGRNLFCRIAHTDDKYPNNAYIAFNMINSITYTLTQQLQIKNRELNGIMIDTGAAYSSNGNIDRYHQYCQLMGHTPSVDVKKSKLIRFGIGKEQSKGIARIDFPIGSLWLTFNIHIVDADIPIILGINDMDNLGVYFNNLINELIHGDSGFRAEKIRFRGHEYVTWDPHLQSHFTTEQLHRLHRRFGHPNVDKLSNFLRRSELDDNPGHTRKSLEEIERHCDPCQRYAQAPRRFKFKIKNNFDFNHCIYADFFYISKKPILHVVDEGTYYQSAAWLSTMKSNDLWNALRRCWIDVYLGPPDMIVHDTGKIFIGKAFQTQAHLFHIETKEVPVEAANSMSIVKRYNLPVKRAFAIIKREAPDTNHVDALQMAIKSINYSIGPHGLVTTLLVYGCLRRLELPFDKPHPSLYERARAVNTETKELSKRYSRRQIKSALSKRNGPNVSPIHETCIGKPVLVYRDTTKLWTGPFRLLSIAGESTTIQMPNGRTTFRTTHLKPYNAEDIPLNATESVNNNDPTIHHIQFCYVANYTPYEGRTETFQQSRVKEFNNLMKRNVLKVVPRSHANGHRIYGSRFVDEIKNVGTSHALEK